MKSLAARALAASTVAAGAIVLAAPVAGAATHGKGGSGQSGDGQTVSQPAHGNGHGGKGSSNNNGNSNNNGSQGGSSQGAKGQGGGSAGKPAKGHHHGTSGGSNKPAQGTKGQSNKGQGAKGQGGSSHGAKGQGGKGQGGGSAPPGNNGTIKVDQAPLTSGAGANHANHPHVSCQLALSFFGFDTGTDYATVQFSAMPPSGSFTPVPVTSGPTAFSFVVSQRTGGGQLDTSQAYTLDVSGLKQAKQGYHIRVVTHVTYSQGSDVKQKVFWYEPCAPQSAAPASGQGSASSESSSSAQTHATRVEHSGERQSVKATEKETILRSSSAPQFGLGAGPSAVTTSHRRSRTQLESSSGSGAFGRGSGPGNSGELASNNGQLPSGAGTDLGWFSPARGSLASDGEALVGLALLGGGGFALRRMRRRRA